MERVVIWCCLIGEVFTRDYWTDYNDTLVNNDMDLEDKRWIWNGVKNKEISSFELFQKYVSYVLSVIAIILCVFLLLFLGYVSYRKVKCRCLNRRRPVVKVGTWSASVFNGQKFPNINYNDVEMCSVDM